MEFLLPLRELQADEATMTESSGKSGAKRYAVRRNLLICLILALATCGIYAQIVTHEFVTYDDRVYIVDNAHLRSGLSLDGIRWAFTTIHAYFWHPVTWVSILTDWELFELQPWGHHLSAMLYHIANTLLLFGVLNRMTRTPWASAFVAGLFALHPLHVESVAWASQRKDLLSTLFGLLAIRAYAAYAVRPGVLRYLAVGALFTLSLMAKPMLVTLPMVLLLLDYWPLNRFGFVSGQKLLRNKPHPDHSGASPVRVVLEKLPLLAISGVFSAIAVWALHKGETITTEGASLGGRMGNAILSYGRYIRKVFWPVDLAVFYPLQPEQSGLAIAIAAVVLVGVSLVVIRRRRTRPYLAVGWFWYLGMLVPVIGLVKVGGYAMADRFTYVPLVGLFVMIAWTGADLWSRRVWRGTVGGAAIAAIIACMVTTFFQTRHWKNTFTLFEHALSVTTNNYVAHTSLGVVLNEDGRFEEAAERHKRALQIAGHYEKARAGLAESLFRLGRYDQAIAQLRFLLREKPDDASAHNNLAEILIRTERVEEAMDHYSTAIRLAPDHLRPRRGLAAALERLGEYDKALAHRQHVAAARPQDAYEKFRLAMTCQNLGKFEQAEQLYRAGLAIQSADPHARRNLGVVLAAQRRYQEAVGELDQAVTLQQRDPRSHYHRASVLMKLGRYEEALEGYREALELAPDHVGALNGLGWLLASCPDEQVRDGNQAVVYAEKGSRLTSHQNPKLLDTLAAAYAETGNFQQAVETIEKAIDKLPPSGREELLAEFRARLELYRARRPYRQPPRTQSQDHAR